jgi:sulfatase maturation enzyme AslB (radical SAM superfamily)
LLLELIEKILSRIRGPAFDVSFYPRRYHSWKKYVNLCAAIVQTKLCYWLGFTWNISRPARLTIDVTNQCNLHCPFCPTGKGEKGRERATLSFMDFQALVDQFGGYLYRLLLCNWGEPLLNKELCKMIRYVEQRGVFSLVSTNLNVHLDENDASELIGSGLSSLSASIDGVTQETYAKYRCGGRLELALENLERLVAARTAVRSDKPEIVWSFTVFRHNEHEIDLAREKAKEIGVDRIEFRTGFCEDPSWFAREDYPYAEFGVNQRICRDLWLEAVVHPDGGIGPCCRQYFKTDDFGSTAAGSFQKQWNNRLFRQARGLFSRRRYASPPEDFYCLGCIRVDNFAKTLKDRRWRFGRGDLKRVRTLYK